MKHEKHAVVLLSGGMDSAVCLAHAITKNDQVFPIAFDYNQRHKIELESAHEIAEGFGLRLLTVELPPFSFVTSALTQSGNITSPHPHREGLPASFVPGRNALFLTIAHAYAQELCADNKPEFMRIYGGMCQTDYSGYPDCRLSFIRRLEEALSIGYEASFPIITPLMHKTKAETFAMADELGCLEIILEQTHTCYEGDRSTRHDWGYGCGECPACKLRAKGWSEFRHSEAMEDLMDDTNRPGNPASA